MKKIPQSLRLFGKELMIIYDKNTSFITRNADWLIIPENLKCSSSLIETIDNYVVDSLKSFIDTRILYWKEKTGLSPTDYRIRKMKTRWGSCTPKTGKIRFNFYLAMLPEDIIDSVIIHELTHLVIPGHQRDFYAYLFNYCPDYDQKRKQINTYRNIDQYLNFG